MYSIIIIGEFYMKKKIKKILIWMKKNKVISMFIILILLFIILGLVAIKVLIFPSYKVNEYGNRLENIETVKLDDSRFNELKNSFELPENVSFKNIFVTGRIVKIFINVDSDIDVANVKELSNNFVNSFSEEEIAYYDFQVYLTGNSDKYPMIGYKNKKSGGLVWNNEGGSSEE